MTLEIQNTIEEAWDSRESIDYDTQGEIRSAVDQAMKLLDTGKVRVAEKVDSEWIVHQWLKKAVLLSFTLNDMQRISGGPGGGGWWDKVPSKFADWDEVRFRDAGIRSVPSAVVRYSAFRQVLAEGFLAEGRRDRLEHEPTA